jgi:hypothetical protein
MSQVVGELIEFAGDEGLRGIGLDRACGDQRAILLGKSHGRFG